MVVEEAWASAEAAVEVRVAQLCENLPKRKPNLKRLRPLIWGMLKPRLWILAGGLALTCIKVLASLTIPQISKRLIDTVLNARPAHPERLPAIVAIVFTATIVQAVFVKGSSRNCSPRQASVSSPICACASSVT